MKKHPAIVFCLLAFLNLSLSLKAQRNNIWYFGNYSGLDFNQASGSPLPALTGNSAMVADEGCSSICDDNGDLLFYTNGVIVYNRNHQQMLNGDNLGGDISAFQSSIIVPHPGDKILYYIFTADAIENDYANGYRYSVVDMRGDNGNGIVISKNTLIWAPGSERMTASRHANGTDVWLITNDNSSNIFRAWLINCSGFQPIPVVSVTGEIMDQHETMNVGALKVSPDGKLLCQTHFPDLVAVGNAPPDYFQLFDFDNASGVISNPRKITVPATNYINCEFSPNSQYIYLCKGFSPSIEQFQTKLPTTAAIINSRVVIPSSQGIYGIQAAPDGKIYLAPTGLFLDVINLPDLAGTACNYQKKQLTLNNSAKLGLPAFINDLSSDPYNNFTYQVLDSCTGLVRFTGSSNMSGTILWSWDFGDGNLSTLQNPVHSFTPSKQDYTVKLIITSASACGSVTREKQISPSGFTGKTDFVFFGGCDSGYVRFENKSTVMPAMGFQYIWDFGDGNTSTAPNPLHVYSQRGNYPVKLKLKTNMACLDDSVVKVVDMISFTGTVNISPDQAIFMGQSVQLYAQGPGNNYEWTPATALSNPGIARPVASPVNDITYTVKVSNNSGCSVEKSVNIKVTDLDDIYVPSGFTPNNDGKNDVLRPLFGTKFILKEFSIFNRWGQKIFSTSTAWSGWDGKINGIDQNSGLYIWMIKISDNTGNMIERKGTSMLIR